MFSTISRMVDSVYVNEELENFMEEDDNVERMESNTLSASDRRILVQVPRSTVDERLEPNPS